MAPYAELAATTNFSFLCGASHPEEMVSQAKELGLEGLGIADRNTVAGVVRAHTMGKELAVKIAVGTRLVFTDGTPDILAYPMNRSGWRRTQLEMSTWQTRQGTASIASTAKAWPAG